jgi:hypothetical protein
MTVIDDRMKRSTLRAAENVPADRTQSFLPDDDGVELLNRDSILSKLRVLVGSLCLAWVSYLPSEVAFSPLRESDRDALPATPSVLRSTEVVSRELVTTAASAARCIPFCSHEEIVARWPLVCAVTVEPLSPSSGTGRASPTSAKDAADSRRSSWSARAVEGSAPTLAVCEQQ